MNELLKLSRIEAHPTDHAAEPVDVAAAAREVAEIYKERMREGGVTFNTDISTEALRVIIPEMEMKQLLTNLLDNALQFTPAGREIVFSAGRSGEGMEIRVKDQGVGIEKELLPKIFDRFFTTENPRTGNRGTGLGLAIVKSITDMNGGRIEVRSEGGHGCEFRVWLPAGPEMNSR